MIADRDPMVREEDAYLFGVRDIDPLEHQNLAESRVNVLTARDWRRQGIEQTIACACEALAARCDHIHLSFDIDVLDAKYVPATGTPVDGGITPEEACEALAAIGSYSKIDSAEFVEYNPELDEDGRTGDLTLRLIEALFAK